MKSSVLARPRPHVLGVVLAGCLAMLMVAIAGCAADPEGASNSGTPVEGGTVRVGVIGEPAGQFDIHASAADVAASSLRGVFDSLVAQAADGTFHPWLATDWEISDDGLRYTFTLRDDVTFTDGEVFNAEVVKQNFDHVTAKSTASQYGAALLGGVAYDHTEVVDEYTVAIVLSEPFASLLQGLSTTYLGFYSPAVLESSADKLAAGGPEVTVGSGPYILDRYVAGQELAFVKNPDYQWGPANAEHTGPARPEQLVLRVLPESAVRAGALTSGEIDVAVGLTPTDATNLEQSGYAVTATPAPGLPYTLFLNHSKGIFTDERLRQAVLRGIDIDSIVETLYAGQFKRAWSVLSPTTPDAYDPSLEGSWPYDQDLANQLLDEAGWTERDSEGYRTKDGKRLTATWPVTAASADRENRGALGEAIQADLKKIGMEVQRDQVEIGAYLPLLQGGDYDIIDWSFVRSDGDILRLHLYSEFAPIQNASFVSDPEVDEWVSEAAQSTDPQRRAELYAMTQQWAIEHAAMVPIYVPATLIGASTDVGGLSNDIAGWPWFYDVWTARQ